MKARKEIIYETLSNSRLVKSAWGSLSDGAAAKLSNAIENALGVDYHETDTYIQELRDNVDRLRVSRDRARVKESKFAIAIGEAFGVRNVGSSAKDFARRILKLRADVAHLTSRNAELTKRNETQRQMINKKLDQQQQILSHRATIERQDNEIASLQQQVAELTNEVDRT